MMTIPESTNDAAPAPDFLDRIEMRLPAIPRAWLRLNRALARTGCSVVGALTRTVSTRGRTVADVADVGRRTVSGQAAAQAEAAVAGMSEAIDTVERSVKTVVGQARAEADQTLSAASTAVVEVLEDVTDQVERVDEVVPSDDFTSMTRAELYALAQERDLDGRSGMTKADLVDALASASV